MESTACLSNNARGAIRRFFGGSAERILEVIGDIGYRSLVDELVKYNGIGRKTAMEISSFVYACYARFLNETDKMLIEFLINKELESQKCQTDSSFKTSMQELLVKIREI